MTATGVVLHDVLGRLRQAGISHLLADPSTRLLDVPDTQAVLSPRGRSPTSATPPPSTASAGLCPGLWRSASI
jgi:hypothetical protein